MLGADGDIHSDMRDRAFTKEVATRKRVKAPKIFLTTWS